MRPRLPYRPPSFLITAKSIVLSFLVVDFFLGLLASAISLPRVLLIAHLVAHNLVCVLSAIVSLVFFFVFLTARGDHPRLLFLTTLLAAALVFVGVSSVASRVTILRDDLFLSHTLLYEALCILFTVGWILFVVLTLETSS